MSITQEDIDARVIPPKPQVSPRWMIEDYEGSDEDMANDIYAAVYWDEYRKAEEEASANGKTIDHEEVFIRTQTMAAAYNRASVQARRLKGTAGRAFDRLLFRVKSNGFYRMTKEEYGSLQEFLMDRLPELDDEDGERSDILFLQTTVIPAIESLGNGTLGRMIGMKDQWSKTRAAVPFLRDHAKRLTGAEDEFEKTVSKLEKQVGKLHEKWLHEKDPEKQQELQIQITEIRKLKGDAAKMRDVTVAEAAKEFKGAFVKAMDVIANPEIPVNGPNGVRHVLKRDGNVTIYTGDKCYPNDESVTFVITLPKVYERAFESILRHLAHFRMTDGKNIVGELGKLILRKGGS